MSQRLCVYNGGFLTEGRLRRILELSGYDISVGVPGDGDLVGIWGRSPTAWRGEAVAGWADAPILSVEDAFLRSLHPGRIGKEDPVGLCLDRRGVHFDGSAVSDLEHLLATHLLDDHVLLDRAKDAIDQIKHWHLGKYSANDPALPLPDPGYVVVIDQTEGDAALMGAGRAHFQEMLAYAADEFPACDIYVKTHPETAGGARGGHFKEELFTDRVKRLDEAVSPWLLFEGALAVYTHSSTLGFEAIFAGLKPRVFGQPFYAGWGLTQDQDAPARRERTLTRAQLFAAAMILYPAWYDPVTDRLCEVEDVIGALAAKARAWREDRSGYVAGGMRAWKTPHMRAAFGREVPLMVAGSGAAAAKKADKTGRQVMVWGMDDAPEGAVRVEDGFLRSNGLGAELTPPLSLVMDAPSLYYDPAKESRLDRLIAASDALPRGELRRAERLVATIRREGMSKYNVGASPPELEGDARTILVVGQVEDDASVRLGAGEIRTNLGLLQHARAENPEARILWKPHPDVEAGRRAGAVATADLEGLADVELAHISADAAISMADEVWTMTSTLGFEALLRGKPVVCTGMPFYAGWGLTRDLAPAPAHRVARPGLTGLAHACLIGYPRYFDPRNGRPLSAEAAVGLLKSGIEMPARNSVLAWLQTIFRRAR